MKIHYLPFFLLGALAACSIENDVPDFEAPAFRNGDSNKWPKLAVTEELLDLGQQSQDTARDNESESERLIARAKALKRRASRL